MTHLVQLLLASCVVLVSNVVQLVLAASHQNQIMPVPCKLLRQRCADAGGRASLADMHQHSEMRYFIGHQKFSQMMEGLVDTVLAKRLLEVVFRRPAIASAEVAIVEAKQVKPVHRQQATACGVLLEFIQVKQKNPTEDLKPIDASFLRIMI